MADLLWQFFDPDLLWWGLVIPALLPGLYAHGRMRRRRGLEVLRPREPGWWADRLNPRNRTRRLYD